MIRCRTAFAIATAAVLAAAPAAHAQYTGPSSSQSLLVQEDPGGTAYIAVVWRIDPTGQNAPLQIFESNRARFISGTPTFLTIDEENSGIIEVTSLVHSAAWFDPTRRYYLGVTQAHYGNGPLLVEGGQFYLMASASSESAR